MIALHVCQMALLKARRERTATITCTYGDNYKVKCKVVVE